MSEKRQYVEVTIRIPLPLWNFLKEQEFFDWDTPEDFFMSCVKRGVNCEVTALDHDKAKILEETYKLDEWTVVAFTKKLA